MSLFNCSKNSTMSFCYFLCETWVWLDSKFQALVGNLWQVSDLNMHLFLYRLLTQHNIYIKKRTHTLWSPTLSLAMFDGSNQTSEGDTLHACVKMLLKGGQTLFMFMFWGTTFVHYLFPAVYVKHTHKWENCKWIFSAGSETHLKTLITPFGFMDILKICSQLYILESTSGHLIRVC